jgi:protocatechuate 3,4-dioxygenase beta subunit
MTGPARPPGRWCPKRCRRAEQDRAQPPVNRSGRLASRRRALALLGTGAAGAALAGCGNRLRAETGTSCPATPTEIRGPFPADGTQGARGPLSVLGQDGLNRHDIRPGFGGMSGRADGIALELELALIAADGCGPLAGRAVYLWQCDARGAYSLYDLPAENYLRGLQVSDSAGKLRFITILPGCYGGRCPHLHLELFGSLAAASHGRNSLLVSQLAFPTAECQQAYADPRYGDSGANLARWPRENDWMFAGNSPAEIAAQTVQLSGDPAAALTGRASVTV